MDADEKTITAIRYWVKIDPQGKPERLGRTIQDTSGLHGELLGPAGWVLHIPVVENLYGHGNMDEVNRDEAEAIARQLGRQLGN